MCIALWTPVRKSGNGISNLEWEWGWNGNVPIWNETFSRDREEQPTGGVAVRLLVLVSEIRAAVIQMSYIVTQSVSRAHC